MVRNQLKLLTVFPEPALELGLNYNSILVFFVCFFKIQCYLKKCLPALNLILAYLLKIPNR